jgi:hypothetical protein
MENTEQENKFIKTRYAKYQEYNKNYHKNYYNNVLKNKNKQCECGAIININNFNRHTKQKKHFKALEKINIEKLNISSV